ncbi:uncharacterized protein [Watersipora subatra]|uniref:uncharacterized protein n=1 Tax=Watersipora subatra TaxID=2589382 RepID=UPI00355B42FE
MLKLIHAKRDAQINALKQQYDELEKKVIKNRQRSKVQITDFLEDVVLDKWKSLKNQRELLESKIKHSPPDVVVRGFKEFKDQMDKFIVEELPNLEVKEQLRLKEKGEKREIELEIVSSDNIFHGVKSNQDIMTLQQLPFYDASLGTSITLLQTIELSSNPISVCQHEGVTYVGLNNGTVSRIDNKLKLHNSFISLTGWVESISVHENRLYMLVSGSETLKVCVYDLSGREMTTWDHPSHDYCCNMLTVAAGKVVVADPLNKRVTVYSLTGKTLHNISCSLLSDNNIVTICAGYGDDVIIADYHTDKIIRLNITTGDIMWTVTHPNPIGLVCYRDYILVAAGVTISIYTLSYVTGERVSIMAHDEIYGSNVYSLSVSDGTLVVPDDEDDRMLFYRLDEK